MALEFTAEQKLLQKTVREFAENEIAPRIDEIVTAKDYIPRDMYQRMADLGFWRVLVPKEHGGLGLGITEACIIHEELSKVAPTLGLIAMCVMTTPPCLLASKPATEKYLKGIMSGKLIANGGVTAPQGHTNVNEWTPIAKKDGDYYILNGSHLYNTNNCVFDVHMVFGYDEDRNMLIWVVEDGMPGLDHSTYENKFGMKGSGGGTVTYKNVRVHKDMCFSAGVGNTMFYYQLYAICSSIGLGAAEGFFAKGIDWAKTRTNNFKPLTDKGFIRGKLAKMNTLLTISRTAIYDSASLLDGSPDRVDEGCLKAQMCKAYVPDACMQVCQDLMKLFAGIAYHDVHYYHYIADILSTGIMDLPTDYQYEGIATLMGLNG
jgi:hypothetical protein